MRIQIILLIVVCFIASPLAAQTTWYVDDDATAPGLGTTTSPFVTITQATLSSSDGDTILVSPGRYLENVPGVAHRLRYESIAGPAVTIVEGLYENRAPVFTFIGYVADSSDLIGFTITGGRGADLLTIPPMRVGGGVLVVECVMGIRNCIFQANEVSSEDGIALGGGIGWIGRGPEVNSCRVTGNYAEHSGGGIGGAFSGPSMAEFHSVMIDNNESTDGGAAGLLGTNAVIYNCTMVDNFAPNVGGVYYDTTLFLTPPTEPQTIVNTIIRDNSPNQIVLVPASANMMLMTCDITGGWTGPGFGNFDAFPAFCDPASGDYRLLEGSPCIDVGQGLPSTPFDFEGDPRWFGTFVDVGADEWTGTFLLACAAGNVQDPVAGTYDVFAINGSAGGIARRVDVAVGGPVALSMERPPLNPNPAHFILWGMAGAPLRSNSTTIGNVGQMCFSPFDPATITVASSFGGPAPLFSATPAPWSQLLTAAIPVPLTATMQGMIVESPTTVRVTNGVILEAK